MFKLHTQLDILAGEDSYGEQEWEKNNPSEGHSRSSRGSNSALKIVEMRKSEESEDSMVLMKASGIWPKDAKMHYFKEYYVKCTTCTKKQF